MLLRKKSNSFQHAGLKRSLTLSKRQFDRAIQVRLNRLFNRQELTIASVAHALENMDVLLAIPQDMHLYFEGITHEALSKEPYMLVRRTQLAWPQPRLLHNFILREVPVS